MRPRQGNETLMLGHAYTKIGTTRKPAKTSLTVPNF